MLIREEFPPNYAEIAAKFPIASEQPIFAYGFTIYNPHKVAIGPELIEHERVHAKRQTNTMGPDLWWRRYIDDQDFRLNEELPAHVAEHDVLIQTVPGNTDPRFWRRHIFKYIALRLISPIYGYQPRISYDRARVMLKAALRKAE